MVFLRALQKKTRLRGATMFLDNLLVHKSRVVQEFTAETGLKLLFNAPYSCTYNPIESLWAYAKRKFFREEVLIRREQKFPDIERRVREAIESIPAANLERCVLSVMQQAEVFQHGVRKQKQEDRACAIISRRQKHVRIRNLNRHRVVAEPY